MSMSRFSAVILILLIGLAGCNLPGYPDALLDVSQAWNTPRPTYVLSMPGATVTPTPFQPMLAANMPTLTPETPIASVLPGEQTAGLPVPPSPTPVLPTPGPPLPTPASQPTLPGGARQVNILLLGSDQRPWEGGFRTDTIVLLTLNNEHGRANLTSFPRDLYLAIPGWGWGRINTAFFHGGFPLLAETFAYNFGVRPDYYVLVNFSSFKRIVDSLGGLEVNVEEPLSDYRAGYWVTIPAGEVHMDADMALWYVRSRATTNDFARNQRQQQVLDALFEKLLSLDALKNAPEFYRIYKDNVITDIGLPQILSWLPMAARISESRAIKRYYIGRNQVYDWITPQGGMVLLPNMDSVMQIIRRSQNLE